MTAPLFYGVSKCRSDLIFLLRSFQYRIKEGKIKGLEELTPFQRYELLNINSRFKD